jgi:hypothetical protein
MRKQNDKRKIEVRRAEDLQTGQKSRQSGCTRNTNLGGGEKISFLEEALEASFTDQNKDPLNRIFIHPGYPGWLRQTSNFKSVLYYEPRDNIQ